MNTISIEIVYDFYLLEAMRAGLSMAKSASPEIVFKHSFERLEIDVEKSFKSLAETLAPRFQYYIWAACLGESRHASNFLSTRIEQIPVGSRQKVYKMAKEFAITQENLSVVIDLFEDYDWPGSYGGRKWYNIAKALELYSEVTPATFIDHCVDLEHNGGCVFNKNGENVHLDTTEADKVKRFLDEKFSLDILTHGISAVVTTKVYTLLNRYNNIVSTVNMEKIKTGREWPEPFDIEYGGGELTTTHNEITVCDRCGDTISRDDIHNTENGTYCESCYEYEFTKCDMCGRTVRSHSTVKLETHTHLYDVCQECAEEKGQYCDKCEKYHTETVTTEDSEKTFCENCWDDIYICTECNEAYEWTEDMDEHMQTHNMVRCEICNEYAESLAEHVIEHHYHPVELQEAEGFDNPFVPLNHDEPVIMKYTILTAEGPKEVTGEVWYYEKGYFIHKNHSSSSYSVSLPNGMYLWSHWQLEKVRKFQKYLISLNIDWTGITKMYQLGATLCDMIQAKIHEIKYGG